MSAIAPDTRTNTFSIELPREIDVDLTADIEKESVYVSEDIIRLTVDPATQSVSILHRDDADVGELRPKVSRFIHAMLEEFQKIESKVHFVHHRNDSGPIEQGVFQELERRNWLFSHGKGQVSLMGPALRLFEEIDARFKALYQISFEAESRAYPAMIRADVLAKCGYFEMHPNAVSFVTHLVNDFDEIEAFRAANEEKATLTVTHSGAFSEPHYCLNPAACFPCYESFEGKRMETEGQTLTWVGRVFRYESGNIKGLDRLWEFSVRELVFLGNESYVQKGREAAVTLVQQLARDWDLDCSIETATDPFFATVRAARTFWQKALDVKSEIRLRIEPDAQGNERTIAAGSINLHGAFFGERFDILSGNGEPAQSACVGFGLERWILALFSQHGFDPQRWPVALRDKVFPQD